jgi:putative addiction module CopG family antidote
MLALRLDVKITLSPEVERLIAERGDSGRYCSADEVVREGLDLLKQREEQTNGDSKTNELDLAATFEAISKEVPEEAWAKVPTDLSTSLDSYLYGSSKKS